MNIKFDGEIWFWQGPAPWFFVTVPAKQCRYLEAILSRTALIHPMALAQTLQDSALYMPE